MTSETLSDIALVTPGTSPKGELINSDGKGYPFFQGSKEFQALYPRAERFTEFPVKMAKKDDILISVRAPVGQVNIAPQDVAIGRGVMSVRPKQDSDRYFVFYLLKWLEGRWDSLGSTGSVFENLSVSALSSVEIPKVEYRETVGRVLFQIDCKIQENSRISKTLEEIAQAIFKSWFIDFEPVKAKMAGEKPVGMDDATAALFPDSMEDSELGPVPTNWHPLPLTNFFDVLSGGTPKTTEASFWGGPIPWFSVVDAPVSGGCFFIKTEKTVTEQGVSNSAAKIVRPGVTIISARGTVGKTAVVATPSTFNQSCYGLMGKYGDFYTYLLVKHMVTRLQNIAHGGMFDTITRETFSALTVPKPMEPVIDTFEKLVEPMFMQIKNLQYQSEQLATMRDALLPRLISGELKIPEEMLAS